MSAGSTSDAAGAACRRDRRAAPKFDPDDDLRRHRATPHHADRAGARPVDADDGASALAVSGSVELAGDFDRIDHRLRARSCDRVNARRPAAHPGLRIDRDQSDRHLSACPDAERKAGSAGLPALHCDVRIVDADGCDLPPGGDGEILVAAPTSCATTGTARTDRPGLQGGWYHSGDVGHFDAERLSLCRRPQERHDHLRRREHLSGRDRGGRWRNVRPSPRSASSAGRTSAGARRWWRRWR